MSNEKAPEKKKKKNKGNTIFILIIALLAAICLFLWKFGFGFGGGNGTGSDSGAGDTSQTETVSDTAESESTETTAETEAETNSLSVEIVVSDDKISANGEEMSDTAALKEYLLSNHVSSEDGSEGTKYTLVDSHALKSAYDSAKAVLDELGYEYSEQTAEE
ncbi:MAG: hypothetical protein SOU50_03970 [Oscillospiraceae bacterium]|nr:hypothetical protein [Oscillospiraceae bacterium]